MKNFFFILSGVTIGLMPFVKFPEAEISNGLIHATIYLPDVRNGYYQGTRFDWSGNIASLEFNGHNYFGQWFEKYSPEIHDAIMGPVEDFTPLDYIETIPGGSFVKIGVGVLLKPDDKPYTFSRLYPIVNRGKWSIEKQSDQVNFTHDLSDENYSYHYEKSVKLIGNKPEMVLTHTLKNTGKKTIETSVYDHNFFVIDKQPVGPGFVVKFPFNITGEGRGFGDLAETEGNKIVFLRDLKSNETVYCGGFEGFGTSAADYDIRIENLTTGAGVRITCDQPFLKLVFWACSTTLCPEPYIRIRVDPGKEISWTIRYEFYTFPSSGKV